MLTIAGACVLFWVWAIWFALTRPGSTAGGAPLNPDLRISAGYGLIGVSITSREDEAIADCTLTIHDREGESWVAVIPGSLFPLATADVSYRDFKASNGAELPGYIGRKRSVYVSCLFPRLQVRRTAAFRAQ